MSKTPKTDAIIASDTGDSGLIAELVQQCRSFEEENKELQEICDKQAQMLDCQAKRNADLFQELQIMRETLEKAKEFVQSWGEIVDTQYSLWNKCMAAINKALK